MRAAPASSTWVSWDSSGITGVYRTPPRFGFAHPRAGQHNSSTAFARRFHPAQQTLWRLITTCWWILGCQRVQYRNRTLRDPDRPCHCVLYLALSLHSNAARNPSGSDSRSLRIPTRIATKLASYPITFSLSRHDIDHTGSREHAKAPTGPPRGLGERHAWIRVGLTCIRGSNSAIR